MKSVYGRTSNCNDSDEEGIQSTAAIEECQADRLGETIVTPPDHMIALELAETPPPKLKPSKAISL